MVADKTENPWRPIESAPKDGTVILGLYRLRIGVRNSDDYGLIRWTKNWNKDGSGAWTDPYCDDEWMEPVFWAHLPPAP